MVVFQKLRNVISNGHHMFMARNPYFLVGTEVISTLLSRSKLVTQGDKNQSAGEWFRVLTTLGTTLMAEEPFSELSPCRLLGTVRSTSSAGVSSSGGN